MLRVAVAVALLSIGCVVQATPRPPPPPSLDNAGFRAGGLRGTLTFHGKELSKRNFIRVFARDGRSSRLIPATDVRVGARGLFFWDDDLQAHIGWDWSRIDNIEVLPSYGGGSGTSSPSGRSSSSTQSGWSESGVHDVAGGAERVGGVIVMLVSGPGEKKKINPGPESFAPELRLIALLSTGVKPG